MNRFVAGVVAGLTATAALSALMLMKSAMGLMPELDVIAMLSTMMRTGEAMAWVAHFAIGALWGILFAVTVRVFPGSSCWMRGVIFSVVPWLLMMIIIMPMAGAGIFGMELGVMAPVMTLMLHLVFGAVLGFTFGALAKADEWHRESSRIA